MNLYKHLATITKSKTTESRPILQQFHYNKESQTISACDSHRILEFKSQETIEKTFANSSTCLKGGERRAFTSFHTKIQV